jgi:hypothetical protein
MIPCALNTSTATTTPATSAITLNQKHQQIHARCLCFFFWPASHESLCTGLAVISVQVLNMVRGLPVSDSDEGQRRACARTDWGRCSVMSMVVVVVGVFDWENVYMEFEVNDEEVRACPRSKGRLLACEADFFNLFCFCFFWGTESSCSRCSCFSASNSDCQICSRRKGDTCGAERGDGLDRWRMDEAGDAKAGDKWHWDVGESGAEDV